MQDIISLTITFPQSFDTTGNMPGVYTICLDPSVPPVQHAHCKVPIECREAIEKLLQDMVDQEIIAPVTEPMEWVSSLTYPQKSDGSLHICLDPRDLNKAIIWEHYKATTPVFFRPNKLLATFSPKFGCQDHLPKGASNQLGLEPLH